MKTERLQLSIQTVKDNIKILESQEPEDAGYYLQLEHEKMVLDALEKQIPKKPIITIDGYFNGQPIYDTWGCPNCGKVNETDFEDYQYCPDCGQSLDWSDHPTEKGGASDA